MRHARKPAHLRALSGTERTAGRTKRTAGRKPTAGRTGRPGHAANRNTSAEDSASRAMRARQGSRVNARAHDRVRSTARNIEWRIDEGIVCNCSADRVVKGEDSEAEGRRVDSGGRLFAAKTATNGRPLRCRPDSARPTAEHSAGERPGGLQSDGKRAPPESEGPQCGLQEAVHGFSSEVCGRLDCGRAGERRAAPQGAAERSAEGRRAPERRALRRRPPDRTQTADRSPLFHKRRAGVPHACGGRPHAVLPVRKRRVRCHAKGRST